MVAALAADTAWTTHDLDTVADAAVESLAEMRDNSSTQASMLVQLAEALSKTGAIVRARDVLIKAGSPLDPPHDFMSSSVRRNIVKDLAKLGDGADAEALANVDAESSVKADLLGELGIARAQARDSVGAQKIVETITALGPSNDPAFARTSGLALDRIGVALVEAGATDDALHVADSLTDRAAASQIIARAATALCSASKADKGRDLAERAGSDARAVAAAVNKPFQMFEPIINAAKAMTACNGLASAEAFVRSAIPPQTQDITRAALINQLGNSGQADLALALAPSPKPDDANSFLDLAKRLVKQGNKAAAAKAVLEASRIIMDAKDATTVEQIQRAVSLGGAVDLLAQLGDYDAAIATAREIPINNRNQYYLKIVGAAVEHKDPANVAKLVPIAIKALNEPTADGRIPVLFLENLLRQLANGGYRNEAQPIFEQLSALSQDTNAPTANRVPPGRLALVKAAMGDVPGALKSADDAGPMVAAPSALQILALATMQFDNPSMHPTPEQIKGAIERAKAALPPQVAGPGAQARSAVVRELAEQGDLRGALEVEAQLEVEPRGVLAPPRDGALLAIADAQIKAGDLRGALATTLQVSPGLGRWNILLRLAANRPSDLP
jgi:tetratricopeptide (TPR) repeat protein